MRDFVNQKAKNLQPSGIRKFFDIANSMDNIISLSIGEPDFDTPAFVCEAAMKDTLKGYTHYAASNGDPELRAALLKDICAKTGLPYEGKNLLVTTGAMHGLLAVMRTLLEAGDEVICFGRCGDDSITPDDWAEIKGTHAYDIICSLGSRVERVALN